MKLFELEQEIVTVLKASGFENAGFECRQILNGVFGGNNFRSENEELTGEILERARRWSLERAKGVPLAYLTGKRGFYKSDFFVEIGVLIPRPESELIVETAIARSANVKSIADLGCGSGCLGLSLLLELPAAKLYAVDISPIAGRVTQRNAIALALHDRMEMVSQSVESYIPKIKFDLVVANPPYIALGDANVQASVHRYEPHEALYSGPDGLEAIRAWSQWSSRNLVIGGVFVCEIGAGQSRWAQDIIGKLDFEKILVGKDLAGTLRVISAVKR